MPDRLPFGEIRPQAQPLSAFLQPSERSIAMVGQPTGVGSPPGISTLQIGSAGSVQGFNQAQQLAEALTPFSNTLLKLTSEGIQSYAQGKIDEGYYAELKNQQARATQTYQLQQEQGAENAAATINQLARTDPQAAYVLNESNPWRLVGRRRALAQLAGQEIDDVLAEDMTRNAGSLSSVAPGSPELMQRKADLTRTVLSKYGLTGEEPEAQFYTVPRLNQAWDKYAERQRTLYGQTLKTNTIDAGTAQLGATLTELGQNGVQLQDGTVVKIEDPKFPIYAAQVLTSMQDKMLAVLGGDDRTEAIKRWREQLTASFGQIPQLSAALSYIQTGPAKVMVKNAEGQYIEVDNPNRPTWGGAAPFDMLELVNKGNGARLQQYEQTQQGIENQLDGLWWGEGMPGSLLPGDPAYPAALITFRQRAGGMGYTDIDGYINRRMSDQNAVVGQAYRPDPLASLDFEQQINELPRSAFTDPGTVAQLKERAREAARAQPTAALQAEAYSRYLEVIRQKQDQAGQATPGLQNEVDRAVLQDLGQGPVKAIVDAAKAKNNTGNAFSQILSNNGGAVAAAGAIGDAKVQAFTIRVNNLFLRNAEAKIDEWAAAHPGAAISASARNVLINEAIAETRKSQEYKDAYKELTGLQPGQVGTGAGARPGSQGQGQGQSQSPGTQPPNGVPRSAARGLSDPVVKAYASRPVMEGAWLHEELENVANGKRVSKELYDMANRAGTTTYRYLQEQLKFYPQLDPKGDVMKFLQEQVRRQRAGQTVSSANYGQLLGGGGRQVATAGPASGGFNPLANGSWLMNMLMPPAAAATLPQGYSLAPGGGGGAPFGGSGAAGTAPFRPILAMLRDGEGGWDSANRGYAGDSPGGIPGLSRMTLGQWKSYQRQGWNALGAYQFIPRTLALAASELRLPDSTVMTPDVQDRLAIQLMVGTKRRRLAAYLNGSSNDVGAAADDLALEWASVHTRRGGSAYAGIGGNAASIGRDRAVQALQRLRATLLPGGRPASQAGGGQARLAGGGGSGTFQALAAPRGVQAAEFGSGYGAHESFRRHPHEGVDIRVASGTPLGLAVPGTVIRVGRDSTGGREANGGYGNYVDVRLANGSILRLAHLSWVDPSIRNGTAFGANQMIAKTGGIPGQPGSGRSGGAHLHQEQFTRTMGLEETLSGKVDPRRHGGASLLRFGRS